MKIFITPFLYIQIEQNFIDSHANHMINSNVMIYVSRVTEYNLLKDSNGASLYSIKEFQYQIIEYPGE